MIARIWHGRTRAADAAAYTEYIARTGIPDYRATPGNRGAWMLRRTEGDVAHFVTLSFWDSLDSIRNFAGNDVEIARYYPEDDRFLLEKEPSVTHYEVVAG